ncbi:MAG: DNA translocase FtsK, partial [Burkholderia sp.]
MHTVVFGWFGMSAVWFIPLVWRLVKGMLPGGAKGGSIRLWLGFASVFVASCTLATALPGDDSTDRFGQLLAAGFEHIFGHIGTPLVMVVLLVAGLPWLFGLDWHTTNDWLDASFGFRLGRGSRRDEDEPRSVADLPRSALHRDEDRRVRRAGDVQPSTANTINSMVPKRNGRFARPTLWRPDPKRDTARDARREPRREGPRGWTPPPTTRTPMVEPSAPAGWLNQAGRSNPGTTGGAAGTAAGLAAGAAAASSAKAASAAAAMAAPPVPPPFVPSSVSMPPSSPNLASSAVQAAQAVKVLQERYPSTRRAAPTAAPIRPVVPPIAQPARPAAAQNLPARTPARPAMPTQNANAAQRRRPTPPARAPLYAWSDKPAQPVEPSPSLRDTLRSIDASTAQWAALAGTTLTPHGDATSEAAAGSAQAAGMFTTRTLQPELQPAAETAPGSAALESPLAFEMATPADTAEAPIADKAQDEDEADDAVIDISAFMPADALSPSLPSWASSAPDAIDESTAKPTEPVASLVGEPAGVMPATSTARAPAGEPVDSPSITRATPIAFGTAPTEPGGNAAPASLAGHSAAFETAATASLPAVPQGIATAASPASPPTMPTMPTAPAEPATPLAETKPAAEPTATPSVVLTGEPAPAAPTTAAAPALAVIPPAPTPPATNPVAMHPTVAAAAAGSLASPASAQAAFTAQAPAAQDEKSAPDTTTPSSSSTSPQHAATSVPPWESLPAAIVPAASTAFTPATNAPTSVTAPTASMTTSAPFAATPPSPVPQPPIDEPATEQAADPDEGGFTYTAGAPIFTPASPAMPAAPIIASPSGFTTATDTWVASTAEFTIVTPATPDSDTADAESEAAPPLAMPSAFAGPAAAEAAPAAPAAATPAQPAPRPPNPNAFEFRAPAASNVELPGLDLLEPASDDLQPISEADLAQTGLVIEQRLQEFKVPVTVVGASAGPVITRFEIEPALGVRGSQIVGLMKDLSRGLGLTSIRVVETIPGKTCMGLELPNAKRQMIRLSEILAS